MQRPHRANRPAQRVVRALVGAAVVPVMLVAAGCSSDAEPKADAKQSADSGKPSAKPSPTVEPAAYAKLPAACDALGKKTLGDLVPKGLKTEKAGRTDDAGTRSGCTWNSLDDNGVKGSQYRWLSVSLLRFDSDQVRGTGEDQARKQYESAIDEARNTADAQKTASKPLEGVGDEATLVTYDLKKKEGLFKQQTVVALVENVVVTLDYNGAGLAGEKAPSAKTLGEQAVDAAREAVTSVTKANGEGGSASPSASVSPSASASASAATS